MGSVKSKEMYFHDLIKNDKDREFFEILTKNKIDYNYCLRYNDYSLLGLAAYYGAIKIIEILTEVMIINLERSRLEQSEKSK